MIGFEDEFEASLRLSKQEFSAHILSIADTDLDEVSAALATTKKPFRGYIKFNRFKLIPTQGYFQKTYGQIEGEFESKNGELLIRGSVSSHRFLLISVIGFTLISFVVLVTLLINNTNEKLAALAAGIFFLIGVGNLLGISRSLKSLKSDFLARLELIEEVKTLKGR